MAEVIRMPRMSDTMTEGNIVAWLKEVGDEVEPGDILAEVETDKATMEFESLWEGHLLYIGIKEGPVPVNGVIAVIGDEGEDFKAALSAAENGAASSNGVAAKEEPKKETVKEAVATNGNGAAVLVETTRIKASPLAKKMAASSGIELTSLQGSGEDGRIVKRDIEAYLKNNGAAPQGQGPKETTSAPMTMNYGDGGEGEKVPLSQMRKTIARRLGESKFTAPHFYLTIDINMGVAMTARKRMNELSPVKISFNDLVIKAAAAALGQHPDINSSWMGDHILKNKNINIGVAVAVPEGLLVPVVKHANMKSLSTIAGEVRSLAGKAKEKKLGLDEMQGNTFTISNLGMFGIEEFTAIINPPDACILAVGGILDKAIVKDGEVVPGKMMKVTLSCDHRVVDGAMGAKFLNTFKDMLEDPIRILV